MWVKVQFVLTLVFTFLGEKKKKKKKWLFYLLRENTRLGTTPPPAEHPTQERTPASLPRECTPASRSRARVPWHHHNTGHDGITVIK